MDRKRVWIAAAAALALLICYAPVLRGMVNQWSADEDMSHGFAVPFVIGWVVWRDRARLTSLEASPTAWGYVLLAGAAAVQIISALGLGLFAASVALLVSAIGVTLCLGGWAYLRALAFPYALSLFMLPKLAIVYNQTTLPLQVLASRLAQSSLAMVGYKVIREGVILDVGGHRVSVAEACSGVRYLLSLAFIAVVFAYMTGAKPSMRWLLLAASVPVAIVANAIRVAVSAAVPALDSGTPHEAAGAAVFVLCLILIFAVERLFHPYFSPKQAAS